MRTFGWLLAILLNAALCWSTAAFALQSDVSATGRFVAAFAAMAATAVLLLLVLARAGGLQSWSVSAMRGLCLSYSILFFLGSLDYGIISGQELWSVLVISTLAWGTWKTFMVFAGDA